MKFRLQGLLLALVILIIYSLTIGLYIFGFVDEIIVLAILGWLLGKR